MIAVLFFALALTAGAGEERSFDGLLQDFSRSGDLRCLVDAYKLCQTRYQSTQTQSGREKEAALEACLQMTTKLADVLAPLVSDTPDSTGAPARREGESAAEYEQRVRADKERIKQTLYQRDVLKLSKAVIELSLQIMSDYGKTLTPAR